MTFAVVQSSWENPEREFALTLGQELRLTKIHRDLRKMSHKHYINVKLDGGGTNVYDTWKTADGSVDWMDECFGAQPRLTIDEKPPDPQQRRRRGAHKRCDCKATVAHLRGVIVECKHCARRSKSSPSSLVYWLYLAVRH